MAPRRWSSRPDISSWSVERPRREETVTHGKISAKLLIVSIVLGPLLLIGAPPAAGQPVPDDTVIQTAATGDSSASKETYRQRADAEMLEWKRRLHGFTERWEIKSQRQVDAAEARLQVAWTATESEA